MNVPTQHENKEAERLGSTATSSSSGFTASYANVPPKQLLDLVLMSRRTAEITFSGSEGTEGRIRCGEGRVKEVAIDGASGLQYLEEVLEISSEDAQVTFSPQHSATPGEALVLEPATEGDSSALVTVEKPDAKPFREQERASVVNSRARRAALFALVVTFLLATYIVRMELRSKGAPVANNPAWTVKTGDPTPQGGTNSTQRISSLLAKPLVPDPILKLALKTEPSDAEIWLDSVLVGHGQLDLAVDDLNSSHDLRIVSEGFVPKHITFLGIAPPSRVELAPLPSLVRRKQALRKRRSARMSRKWRRTRKVAKGITARREKTVKRIEPKIEVIGDTFPAVELIQDVSQVEKIQ